jgi:hypothetical protein
MPNLLSLVSSIFSIQKILNLKDFIAKYLKWAVARWARIRDLWLVLHYARFSVFVLVVGAGLLFLSDQGRELALRIGANFWHVLFFYIGLFFWALQNWFGSRRLLNERFGRPDRNDTSLLAVSIRHVPSFMGTMAYAFALVAVFRAWWQQGFPFNSAYTILIPAILASGVGFYYFFIHRHEWFKDTQWARYNELKTINAWLRPATYGYSLCFLFGGMFFPAHLGFWVGSLGVLFFALGSIVPAGNWAIRYTEHVWHSDPEFGTEDYKKNNCRVAGFPVISALLILALALSFINDNHAIRTLDGSPKRPTLGEAFDSWEQQAPEGKQAGIKPLVIVATAGGGIRASYWTASVLGGLTDAEPRFRNSLFAISGVSGGSVGSAFYQAALREGVGDCGQAGMTKQPKRGATCYEGLTRTALSQDFLAPNLSSLFYSDLIQRFLPPLGFPDRQQALEKG